MLTLIAKFMGPTWGPSGADRTQVGPMSAPWTLLCWNIGWHLHIGTASWGTDSGFFRYSDAHYECKTMLRKRLLMLHKYIIYFQNLPYLAIIWLQPYCYSLGIFCMWLCKPNVANSFPFHKCMQCHIHLKLNLNYNVFSILYLYRILNFLYRCWKFDTCKHHIIKS